MRQRSPRLRSSQFPSRPKHKTSMQLPAELAFRGERFSKHPSYRSARERQFPRRPEHNPAA